MIKILVAGLIPQESNSTIYTLTCHYCNCVFEASNGDISSVRITSGKQWVECPTCSCNVEITKDTPSKKV